MCKDQIYCFDDKYTNIVWALYGYRLIVALIMVGVFIKLFLFFFKLKKAKLAKDRKDFEKHQKVITIYILFLVFINTVAFILRGFSPKTNKSNEEWMRVFDYFCMIYFSINDSITALGITVMFYYIGRSEVTTNRKQRKVSAKTRAKLGHSNFETLAVDEGGDLS